MLRDTWIDRAREVGVLAAARALGLRTTPARGSHGGTSSCPACGRERRNASTPGERRGAIGIARHGRGWRCHPCNASGDVIDLVAFALGGARYRDLQLLADRHAVAQWFSGSQAPRYAPQLESDSSSPPEYPTRDAGRLWRACTPVTADREVSDYLRSRGIDPAAVARLDIARALPESVTPAWARHRLDDGPARPWALTGHRLIVPLRDVDGAGRNVLARAVRPSSRKSTCTGARAGLVMCTRGVFSAAGASGHGVPTVNVEKTRSTLSRHRDGLENTAIPAEETSPHHEGTLHTVVLREGEIDYLETAQTGAPAIGIFSGAWTDAHALRLPRACTLRLKTDADAQGAAYAGRIVESLASRADVRVVLADHFRFNGRAVALKGDAHAA